MTVAATAAPAAATAQAGTPAAALPFALPLLTCVSLARPDEDSDDWDDMEVAPVAVKSTATRPHAWRNALASSTLSAAEKEEWRRVIAADVSTQATAPAQVRMTVYHTHVPVLLPPLLCAVVVVLTMRCCLGVV